MAWSGGHCRLGETSLDPEVGHRVRAGIDWGHLVPTDLLLLGSQDPPSIHLDMGVVSIRLQLWRGAPGRPAAVGRGILPQSLGEEGLSLDTPPSRELREARWRSAHTSPEFPHGCASQLC